MRAPALFSFGLGALVLTLAALVCWRTFYERNESLEFVASPSAPAWSTEPGSVTGWAHGQRVYFPAERRPESYEAIVAAQALAGGEALAATVTYDNAPTGRPVPSNGLYTRWLACGGKVFAVLSGVPTGVGVELAARWWDPLTFSFAALFTLLMLVKSLGILRACAVAATWFLLEPLTERFMPGAPNAPALGLVLAGVGTVLLAAEFSRWRSPLGAVFLALAWLAAPSAAYAGLALVPAAVTWALATRRAAAASPLRRVGLAAGAALVLTALAVAGAHWGGRTAWVAPLLGLGGLAAAAGLLSLSAPLVGPGRWISAGVVVAIWIPGLVAHLSVPGFKERPLAEEEAAALVERDLAYWLAARTRGSEAVVLAPPSLSQACWYHGGLKVVASANPGNTEGLKAAVRLCGASSADEARALFEGRGITHVVMPSWDGALYEFAKLGSPEPDKGFMSLLYRWMPPRWLRPVAYQLPQISGWQAASVTIFEVVEVQDNATALSRLAEYFVHMGRLNEARAVAKSLAESFPDELISLLAQGQVARARKDASAWQPVQAALLPQLEAGNDETLEWPERVSLALLLAESRQTELARGRLQLVLSGATPALLQKLDLISLFRILRVTNLLKLTWPDPTLREQAEALLPSEYRDQLNAPSR